MVSLASSVLPLFALFGLSLISTAFAYGGLSYNYYDNKCDDFEDIVARMVRKTFEKDFTIAASLLRLHFHDCSVRGCDASILLDYPESEMKAKPSKTLRGFNVINKIKRAVEKKCPRTVSCADILTAAARDSTYLVGGPYWSNYYGRKDGLYSIRQEAEGAPNSQESVTSLIEFYQSLGLSTLDLVILSGAHTIGKSSCGSFLPRLYNFKGTGRPDPSISPKYLNYLKRKCGNQTVYADLDPITPNAFDNTYYKNLQKNMGLLYTDQILNSDHRTARLVDTFATQPETFPNLFASSMVKLGGVLGDAEEDGEIRYHCSRINAHKTSKHY
ncbi:peroxidase 7 [Silene latifolia]|uniref:peroxidase 7 n=1 Tax=Silene latifolia TaxID=37657 RepID=UPI003D77EED4